MRRFVCCLTAMLLMLAGSLVAGPVHAQDGAHPIARYAVWNAHREDAAGLAGWAGVYTMTTITCESAIEGTLIQAYRDGWAIDAIDPPFLSIVRAFPDASPCSATLALS